MLPRMSEQRVVVGIGRIQPPRLIDGGRRLAVAMAVRKHARQRVMGEGKVRRQVHGLAVLRNFVGL